MRPLDRVVDRVVELQLEPLSLHPIVGLKYHGPVR